MFVSIANAFLNIHAEVFSCHFCEAFTCSMWLTNIILLI